MINKTKILLSVLFLMLPVFGLENDTLINDTVPELISTNITVNDSLLDVPSNETIIDNSTTLNDTIINNDLRIMHIPEGVIVRFNQLIDKLDINIQKAEKALEFLSTNYSEVDSINLSLIVDELKIIVEEAEFFTNVDNINDTKDAAETFVELKTNSVELINEFRNSFHELVSVENLEILKNQIANIRSRYNNIIKEKIQNFNKENVRRISKDLNLNNESLNNMFNGSLNKVQIMNSIKNKISNLNQSKINVININVKNVVAKDNVLKNYVRDAVKENITQRITSRVEARMQKIVKEEVSNVINNNKDRLIEKIQQNLDKRNAVRNKK
jgi:hypothetical protein